MPNRIFSIHPEVAEALNQGRPVVALESTVITHGLPHPENLRLAAALEAEIRSGGAIPATVGILGGIVRVGLSSNDLKTLAEASGTRKVSARDIAAAQAQGANGGTTVAGTLAIAQRTGIRVFATGGIGGVHRDAPGDISADLPQLGLSPLVVVCAGAKAILDLPATLEMLETTGVPVIGYQTDEFPAFYAAHSGLPVSARADTAAEIARIAHLHWEMGLNSAILVANPPPPEAALNYEEMDAIVAQALAEAHRGRVRGQAVTPFLLKRVSELSGGASLHANLALLINNARLAAQIAACLAPLEHR
jgi:pseudouridine-5'-phosphate glycosidase